MKVYLGIDIGTTNLKIAIVNGEGDVVHEESSAHNAHVNTTCNHDEQDPRKILTDLEAIFKKNKHLLHGVEGITVTGQMHGIVFWDSTTDVSDGTDKDSMSNLITWMDQRCDKSFLQSLPPWEDENGAKESNISSGYGLATLIWLHKHGLVSKRWDRCGTIMDFVVFSLGIKEYFISDQLAFSWGYMTNKNEWQKNVVLLMDHLALPEIKPSGTIYSNPVISSFFSKDVKIYVSVGDLQANLFGFVSEQTAALHLGTSAQLAYCSFSKMVADEFKHLLRVPYFNGKYLIVAASLNGGNALDNFVKLISTFHDQLFGTREKTLDESNLHQLLEIPFDQGNRSDLIIRPLFLGERHSDQRAFISNLSADTRLDECLRAIRKGMIENLSDMLPVNLLESNGIQNVILLNRAASDNVCFITAKQTFEPLNVIKSTKNISAALGAAKLCIKK